MIGVKLPADKLEEMTNQKRKKCQEDPNDIIIWTSNWGFANVSSLKVPDTVNLHKRQTKHHELLTKQTEELENEIRGVGDLQYYQESLFFYYLCVFIISYTFVVDMYAN